MEVQQYPSKPVLDTICKLTPEHYAEVSRLEACEIRDTTRKDIEKSYQTLVKAIGRFYAVKGDYLILTVETSLSLGARVLCIPIGTILKLKILTRKPVKVPLRISKAGMALKMVYIYVKDSKAKIEKRSAG